MSAPHGTWVDTGEGWTYSTADGWGMDVVSDCAAPSPFGWFVYGQGHTDDGDPEPVADGVEATLGDAQLAAEAAMRAARAAGRLADLGRPWRPGDACASFLPGGAITVVFRIDGSTVHLVDGSSGDVARMLRPRVRS